MKRLRWASPVALLAVGLGLVGLWARSGASSLAPAQSGCPPAPLSENVRLAVQSRADNALIADAAVDLATPAPIFLEYGTDQLDWLRTPTSPAASSHRLPIARLRPQTTYQVRAFSLDDTGCPTAAAATALTTGALPPDLQPIAITSSGRPSSPLTLMDFHSGQGGLRWLLSLDADGQVVWYYRIPREAALKHAALTVIQHSNGNFLYLFPREGIGEVTPDGREIRFIKTGQDIHHDLFELPDGRVLFLGWEPRTFDDSVNGGPTKLQMRGDTVFVLDLATGKREKLWNAWEVLDPTQRVAEWAGLKGKDDSEDWTHGNTVSLGPRGNVLLSFRHLNQVISLSPDFKTIEWKLGGPGSSFSFPDPGDQFYGQHTARELPGGRILMLDNGNFRAEQEYSRALELELDFTTMTARKIWEYRHTPDLFADSGSSAFRLPNGDTLVNFGFLEDPQDPVLAVEAGPDGSVSWELTMAWKGSRAIRYRAQPLTTLGGEVSVEPSPVLSLARSGR